MDHRHRRFAFLDGIRGIAAIFVLTRHTQQYWGIELFRSYLAVDLFFILSGFVIGYAYDGRIQSGSLSIGRFLATRIIRLYPVYFLALLIGSLGLIDTALLQYHFTSDEAYSGVSSLLLALFVLPSHAKDDPSLFPVNGPAWSLFFELVVNAIYVTLRPALTDLALVLILFGSGFVLCNVALLHHGLDIGFTWDFFSFEGGAARSMFGIFLGLFLFRHLDRIENALSKLKRISPWWAVLLIAAVLGSPSLPSLDWALDLIAVILVFPICILMAARQKDAGRSRRLLLLLGSASYPMYILHKPLYDAASQLLPRVSLAPLSGIIFVLALVSFSVWLEKWYDIPIRSRLSRLLLRHAVAVHPSERER
jgi:peptidoglycan/LPS O-acetylase OafA/YrhL